MSQTIISETDKELLCMKVNCDEEGTDQIYKCCYNLTSKIGEFLHKDVYMLEYKNTNKKEDSIDRIKILYSKLFQSYNVLPNQKINNEYNQQYFNTFGIIPLELIPASYIPFNYKNFEMNLDRLSKGDIFYEDDYKKIFIDYNKLPDPNNKDFLNEKDIKGYLEICLKDKLSNPKLTFNAFSIITMTIIVCIIWFLIIIMMLYILFYYYRDIYSYILLGITIILVLIAIIWKMIYILNID